MTTTDISTATEAVIIFPAAIATANEIAQFLRDKYQTLGHYEPSPLVNAVIATVTTQPENQ